MTSTVELRFQWPVGHAIFKLTPQQALKAAVMTRNLGLGLTFKEGQTMITKKTAKFVETEILLQRIR